MMSYVLVEQAGQPQQAIEVLKQQMLTVSSEELQLHLAHAYRDYGSAAAYPQYAPSLQMAMMMYQAVLSQNPGCSDAKQVCSTYLLLPTSWLRYDSLTNFLSLVSPSYFGLSHASSSLTELFAPHLGQLTAKQHHYVIT